MNFGNFGAGLAAMYPGTLTGRQGEAATALQEMQTQDMASTQQAQAMRGLALLHMFGAGGGGGWPDAPGGSPQPPMPGQPSAPAQPAAAPTPQPVASSPGPAFSPPSGPQPSPAPRAPGGSMDDNPAPVTAPQPAAGPAPQGSQGAPQQRLAGVGQSPNGQPMMWGQVPRQPLTWQMIATAVAKANPGAPPQAIAKAIDQFAPMMTTESQLQWHMMKMQQDMTMLGIREGGKNDRSQLRESGLYGRQAFNADLRRDLANQRSADVQISADTRLAVTRMSAESKRDIADLMEGGRNDRQFELLQKRDDWKKLDDTTKHEIADAIIEAQNERAAKAQEGQTNRTAMTQQGANARAAGVQEGANTRAAGVQQGAGERQDSRNATALTIAGGRPITGAQYREQEKTQRVDSFNNTITDAIQDVVKGHKEGANVVGAFGKARGIWEIAGNIAGWTDETRRAEFVQKIRLLQVQAPGLLAGRFNTSKDERAKIDEIIQGLSPGSTKQATLADLQYLQKKMQEVRPRFGATATQRDLRNARTPADSGNDLPPSDPRAVAPPAKPAGGATLRPMTPEKLQQYDQALKSGKSRAEIEAYLRQQGFDPASTPASK